MRRQSILLKTTIVSTVVLSCLTSLCSGQENSSGTAGNKSVLIVYHGGNPPWKSAPALETTDVDELSHATTKDVNVKVVAERIRDRLSDLGYRIEMKKATDVRGPDDFLEHDGIIFGTPTWFSNVAYPIKKVFDEHLIRIYEHRKDRLNDKALAGFTIVMDRKSGPQCLEALTRGLEHLSENIVEGMVINTSDDKQTVNTAVSQFCERFSRAIKR